VFVGGKVGSLKYRIQCLIGKGAPLESAAIGLFSRMACPHVPIWSMIAAQSRHRHFDEECRTAFGGVFSRGRLDAMLTRRTLSLSLLFSVAAAGVATAAPNKPGSVIHVITIQWKAGATPEQIQQAIRGGEHQLSRS
jgi:hypothetical protein